MFKMKERESVNVKRIELQFFVPVDQKKSNTPVTEDFLTVTYDKEVAQQVVYTGHVNKAMKIG